jgi:hypothetical protein
MAELKTAFRNLKIAVQLVRPWDYSILVLESFFLATDYLESQLSGVKKAPVIAGFLDHVLRINAANWLQNKPFMGLQALKALWDPWWAGHRGEAVRFEGQKGGQQNQQGGGKGKKRGGGGGGQGGQQGQSGQQGQQAKTGFWSAGGIWVSHGVNRVPPPEFGGPPSKHNICKAYNTKTCQNTFSTCVVNGKSGPFRLYHLCSHVSSANGKEELCAAKHAEPDHK